MEVWLNEIELKRGLNFGILLDLINLGCFGREREREKGNCKGYESVLFDDFFFSRYFFHESYEDDEEHNGRILFSGFSFAT